MKKKISTTLPDGTVKEYDVIITFKNDDTGKYYCVYTDNAKDEEGKLKIFAAIYNPDTFEFLGAPTTTKEWNDIYKIVDKTLLG